MNTPKKNEEYINWVVELKQLIYSSQIKASLSVNREMLAMYWEIGQSISQKVETMQWGTSIVDVLAKDLKKLFPNQKGFSTSHPCRSISTFIYQKISEKHNRLHSFKPSPKIL